MFLKNINKSNIHTINEFAALLSTTGEEIELFLKNQEAFLQYGLLRKTNGEYRKIVKVKHDSYRHFLKELSNLLSAEYYVKAMVLSPQTVHGFVKGKSIITNAQQHTQKKIILNVDIKSFFDSISIEKVREVFCSIGFKEEIADVLSKLTTVEGKLPTGFSTSPVLSNLVCLLMDGVFERLCKKKGFTYTRYADDITFSSDGYMPSREGIVEVFEKFGFTINEQKYRLYRKGGPQYVTGLTVVDSRPRLSKRFKRRLRLESYYIKKYGVMEHYSRLLGSIISDCEKLSPSKSELNEMVTSYNPKYLGRLGFMAFHGFGLEGFISYIHSVEPELAKKLSPNLPRRTDAEHDIVE